MKIEPNTPFERAALLGTIQALESEIAKLKRRNVDLDQRNVALLLISDREQELAKALDQVLLRLRDGRMIAAAQVARKATASRSREKP